MREFELYDLFTQAACRLMNIIENISFDFKRDGTWMVSELAGTVEACRVDLPARSDREAVGSNVFD